MYQGYSYLGNCTYEIVDSDFTERVMISDQAPYTMFFVTIEFFMAIIAAYKKHDFSEYQIAKQIFWFCLKSDHRFDEYIGILKSCPNIWGTYGKHIEKLLPFI